MTFIEQLTGRMSATISKFGDEPIEIKTGLFSRATITHATYAAGLDAEIMEKHRGLAPNQLIEQRILLAGARLAKLSGLRDSQSKAIAIKIQEFITWQQIQAAWMTAAINVTDESKPVEERAQALNDLLVKLDELQPGIDASTSLTKISNHVKKVVGLIFNELSNLLDQRIADIGRAPATPASVVAVAGAGTAITPSRPTAVRGLDSALPTLVKSPHSRFGDQELAEAIDSTCKKPPRAGAAASDPGSGGSNASRKLDFDESPPAKLVVAEVSSHDALSSELPIALEEITRICTEDSELVGEVAMCHYESKNLLKQIDQDLARIKADTVDLKLIEAHLSRYSGKHAEISNLLTTAMAKQEACHDELERRKGWFDNQKRSCKSGVGSTLAATNLEMLQTKVFPKLRALENQYESRQPWLEDICANERAITQKLAELTVEFNAKKPVVNVTAVASNKVEAVAPSGGICSCFAPKPAKPLPPEKEALLKGHHPG